MSPHNLVPYLELLSEFIEGELPADVFQAHFRMLWASDTTPYPREVRGLLEGLASRPEVEEQSDTVEFKLEADRVRLALQDFFSR